MTETNDRMQAEAEGKVESKIASKFQSAREAVMAESAELSAIYRSITKPGMKDVYNSWVNNMDVVANTYSWGKEKSTLTTKLMKGTNRIVGLGSAAFAGVGDLVINTVTWLPRKVPFIGHFLPHDTLKRHSMRMAESAKRDALIARGVVKVIDAPGKVIAEALDRSMLGAGPAGAPELRAAWKYAGNKASEIKDAILHPKSKAA
jgi:hypothetical protein